MEECEELEPRRAERRVASRRLGQSLGASTFVWSLFSLIHDYITWRVCALCVCVCVCKLPWSDHALTCDPQPVPSDELGSLGTAGTSRHVLKHPGGVVMSSVPTGERFLSCCLQKNIATFKASCLLSKRGCNMMVFTSVLRD